MERQGLRRRVELREKFLRPRSNRSNDAAQRVGRAITVVVILSEVNSGSWKARACRAEAFGEGWSRRAMHR